MIKDINIRFASILFLVFSIRILFAQPTQGGNYLSKLECGNYNSFMTGDSIEALRYYTDTIYPSGILNFDLSKSGEYNGIEDLYSLLEVDQGITFELMKTSRNRFDKDKKYLRYQQYYQGIKVDGGGYTVSAFISGDPDDPCEVNFMLSPHILSNINVSISPNFDSDALDTILSSTSGIKSELVISLNLLNDCQYHLAWKVHYVDNESVISWVDAHTGSILKTIESFANLDAPTQAYGNQNLDDSFIAGTQRLITVDSVVRTFDFESTSCPSDETGWNVSLIPSTIGQSWTTIQASSRVYQTHYVTAQVVPVFESLGIVFESVDMASCNEADNAVSFNDEDSVTIRAFIKVGRTAVNNRSLAVFDVIAHELAHAYLFDYLDYSYRGNKTVHEGICDMVGTYIESIIQGSTDWIIGDDVAEVATLVGRDLQNPQFDCMNSDVANISGDNHARSTPLSHWFYLISTGNGQGLPGLGIEKTTLIVLESVQLMGVDDDYPQFRDATIAFVDEEFGPCSPESRAVRAAWQKICVTTSTCEYSIVGDNIVCEEDNSLHLCISGGVPGVTFNWQYPYGWVVQGGSSSGGVNGTCLTVTDFPKYNWYPQYFQVKAIMLGTGMHKSRTVKLKDCLGDDPTCEEYNSLIRDGSNNRLFNDVNLMANSLAENKSIVLKVFDLNGKQVYSGIPDNFLSGFLPYNGLFVFAYFDNNGTLIKSEKRVLIR